MNHNVLNVPQNVVAVESLSLLFHDFLVYLGQVVQSIVSLTKSLRRQFVRYMLTILSNPLFFLLKKCENLLQCKRFSHFSNKKYQWICNIYILNFNGTLTNDVDNFEQPAPG